MTTKAENEALCRVGPGTPGGEMFRRYWMPVGISADLQDKPTMVRILGEDLVLYRDASGTPGLVGALCSHRRANLALGSVTSRGLQCRYHGWQYDAQGHVLNTPGEPDDTGLKESVQHLAYPVEESGGIVFAYLGPQPAPLLPHYDFTHAPGERHVKITGIAQCNWLQCVENGIDPLHVSFTHHDVWEDLQIEPTMGFEDTPWGLVHKAYRSTEYEGIVNYREHHLIMPGISIGGSQGRNLVGPAGTPPLSCRWSVPIDDETTLIIRLIWKAADNPGVFKGDPLPRGWRAITVSPFKEYLEQTGNEPPTLGYTMPPIIATEDATILQSMGPIVDRENENLLTHGDYGVQTLRSMYLKAIGDVQAGRDPLGTFRADHHVITVPAYELDITEEERRAKQTVGV
jgi:5,5'-dehydrodivanillate O-demethylase oxygenase subunit